MADIGPISPTTKTAPTQRTGFTTSAAPEPKALPEDDEAVKTTLNTSGAAGNDTIGGDRVAFGGEGSDEIKIATTTTGNVTV